MNLALIAATVYGALAIVGGILGYIQARSKISLLAGCGCGVLLLLSALAQMQGQAFGLIAAVGITALLWVAFLMRWLKTRKFMPAGLMLILGVPTLGVMMSQLFAS
jgi:uncharacterized membrane protein (UPF0136 family)